MADINLEIQGKNSKTLSLTLLKNGAESATKVRFHIPSNGEKVKPSPDEENPSDGGSESSPPSTDKPKAKKSKNRLVLIVKIIAAIVVIVGVANFFLWVVINPRKMKFFVASVDLVEFSLSDDYTLRYNLHLNFTVRNPNKRIGFRYDSIVVGAYFEDEKFDSRDLSPFRQLPKTTTNLDTWLSGARSLSLDLDAVKEFKDHESSRVYPIDVKIRVYCSVKLGKLRIGDFKVKVKCGLKVPIKGSVQSYGDGNLLGTSYSTEFKTTQCHVDFNPFIVIYNN